MIKISDIITYLNSVVNLTTLVGSRIYWGVPKNETQAGIYINVNVITGNTTLVEKKNRVEFRIIAPDEDTTFGQLEAVHTELIKALLQTDNQGKNYNGFETYKLVEGNLTNLYEIKNRKALVQDILFYFTY